MYLLVTGTMLEAISTELAGGAGVLHVASDRGIVREGFAAHEGIKLSVWALPAIPIPHLSVNQNRSSSGNIGDDGYILPVVDGRYFWQFVNTGEMSAETFANPSAMLTYLTGRVTEDVTIQTLEADYDVLPDVSANDYEPLAPVLDSVASQLGLYVVPDLTPASHSAADSGNKFALLSPAASATIHSSTMAGLGGLDGSVQVGLPQFVSGDDLAASVNGFAPASARVKTSETSWQVTAASATSFAYPTVPSTEVVLRYSWADDVTASLAAKVAEDFYLRFLPYDKTMVGVQNVQPTCYTDCLIVTIKTDNGDPMETTRMRGVPFNLHPEEPSGGGDAVDAVIGHGVITQAVCDEYYVEVDPDAATTWVNGCQQLPVDDTYDGTIRIYDPCPDVTGKMAGWTEAELLGAVVQFYEACNMYTGEEKYFIIDICVGLTCDEVA